MEISGVLAQLIIRSILCRWVFDFYFEESQSAGTATSSAISSSVGPCQDALNQLTTAASLIQFKCK
jgi:hypothetical protein